MQRVQSFGFKIVGYIAVLLYSELNSPEST